MDESNINNVKTILRDAAEGLRGGADGDQAFRNTIVSLIRTEAQARQTLSSLSEQELDKLIRYNRRLVDAAARFLPSLLALPLTPEQEEAAAQLSENIQNAQADLDSQRHKLKELNKELARVSADCRLQKAENDRIREQVEAKRKTCLELDAEKTSLEDDLKTYSDEAIAQKEKENNDLSAQVIAKRSAFNAKNAENKTLQEELTDLQKRITACQDQIDAQPEALRRLEETHSRLTEKLTRIQNAAVECSEERQAELQARIDELQPVADQLKADYDVLTETLNNLNESHGKTLEETAQAETDLLNSMNAAVDALQGHSEALAGKLRQAMDRSRQFEDNLKLCRDAYDRYCSWFGSDVPALTALCEKAGLSENEYHRLYETLDVGQCDEVRTLMQETEERLNRLDRILSDGSETARQDQNDTLNLAEQGTLPSGRN